LTLPALFQGLSATGRYHFHRHALSSARHSPEHFSPDIGKTSLIELLSDFRSLKGDDLNHAGVFLLHRYAETMARLESFQRISNLSGKRNQVK
jgi:hypothetical protein